MPSTPADRRRDPSEVLARVYAEGIRRRQRRRLAAAATSAAGVLSLGLLALMTVGGATDRGQNVATGVLSTASNALPHAPGSQAPGLPPSEPGAPPTSPAPADPATTVPPPTMTTPDGRPVLTTTTPGPPTTGSASTPSSPTTRVPGLGVSTTTFAVPSTSVPPTTEAVRANPQRVTPAADVVDLQPQRFEAVSPEGPSALAVRYWSGPEPCTALGRVDVAESEDAVVVTLWVGRPASTSPDTGCIAVAVSYETVVQLERPLDGRVVLDGATT